MDTIKQDSRISHIPLPFSDGSFELPLVCRICGWITKEFIVQIAINQLIEHFETEHFEERGIILNVGAFLPPFVCRNCGAAFADLESYLKHQ